MTDKELRKKYADLGRYVELARAEYIRVTGDESGAEQYDDVITLVLDGDYAGAISRINALDVDIQAASVLSECAPITE